MLKQILFIAAVLASLPALANKSEHDERVRAYIAKYKSWAQSEQQRTGIPAAITLAQGVFETNAGASELATEANNHFGIKCKKEWTGSTFAHDDDAPQECFRKYNSAFESYKDHSDYLLTNKRYAPCFALQATDYAGWAKQLRRCGYATNPVYAQKLIKIIEDYNLQDYTLAALNTSGKKQAMIASAASPVAAAMMAEEKKPGEVVPNRDTPTEQPEYGHVVRRNGLKGFWARRGDVLLEYAIQYKVRYARLLEINGLPDAPLTSDQFVYLEKGNAVERIIAKDQSTPVPVQATAAPAPAVAESVKANPELVASSAPVMTSVANEPIVSPTAADVAPTPVAETISAPAVAETAAAVPAPKPVQQAASSPSEEEFNIANEKAVEEQKAAEPQDEFGRMKARFDKVIYAPAQPKAAPMVASASPVATPIPSAEVPAAAQPGPTHHTVKTGETAFGIAKQYGISMQALMDMNKLSFGTSIKVGQKLRVR